MVTPQRSPVRLGRAQENDIRIGDDFASRLHGSIEYRNGRFQLTDTSSNGTLVLRTNRPRLFAHRETVLLDGQGIIRLGPEGEELTFCTEVLNTGSEAWEPVGPGAPTTPEPENQCLFRKEGDYWTLAYDGSHVRLKDAKGLHYLAIIMQSPGQEVHTVDLVLAASALTVLPRVGHDSERSAPDLGAAGPNLDPTAKGAYKQRLAELRSDLEKAEEHNDLGRVQRAHEEIAFLEHELTTAVGLGGRDRPVASHVERARVMVTIRIKAILKKISQCHPTLGHHLRTSIKTGRMCSYQPDPAHPIDWVLR